MKFIGASLSLVALSVSVGTAALGPARAHGWYPKDCCHDNDCAPVESTEWQVPTRGGRPRFIVTSKHGRAVVRDGVSIRPSKDNRMHVCMMRYDALGEMEVTCLFMPPET